MADLFDEVLLLEQQAAFADGTVGLDEYQAGFALFQECANVTEPLVVDIRTDPITGLVGYGVNGELSPPGVSNGSPVDDCYQRYFSFIEATWQTTDPGMIEEGIQQNLEFFRLVVQPCLDANGVETPDQVVPGSEEFADLSKQFTDLVAAGKCDLP